MASKKTSKAKPAKPEVEIELAEDVVEATEEDRFGALEYRMNRAEAKLKVIEDGYEFVANEVRPLYGMGAVSLVFDAIYKRLQKV